MMIIVLVKQGTAFVRFTYKDEYLQDAVQFANECLETGKTGTEVTIRTEEDM